MKTLCFLFIATTLLSCGSGTKNTEEDSPYFDSYSYYEVSLSSEAKETYLPNTKYPFNDPSYMSNINALIEQSAGSKLNTEEFVLLVKTVAWTESSWGHYIKNNDKTYVLLGDSGHSFGMMQIHNAYHAEFPILEENLTYGINLLYTAYNKATSESCSSGSNSGTSLTHIIRRTYAQYNGGPSAMCRDEDARDTKAIANFTEKPWQTYLDSSTLLIL